MLPVIFPAIKIPVSVNVTSAADAVTKVNSFLVSDTSSGTTISASVNLFDYNRLFTQIYFIIAGVLLLRIFISLISTYRIIRGGRIKNSQFPKVVISDNQVPPFSFFPYAVIPAEEYKNGNCKDLLDHEFAHIRQGHTFDLLLSEFIIAVQWFNPFVWLIRRSIVLNHEYLADKVTLINIKSVKEYQYRLLNFQSGLKNISMAHSFNSLIKNRIIMINKKPTRKYAMLKTIIILPVVAFSVYAFATPENSVEKAVSEPLYILLQPAIIQKIQEEEKQPAKEPEIKSPETKPIRNQRPETQSIFSKTSEVEILKFLGMNTGYPQEAKSASDTGRVYVVVKLIKGGIVKECKAYTEKTGIKAPFLPEIVIVGYKSASPEPGEIRPGSTPVKPTGNGLVALQNESVRVANTLSVNEIPDWMDKDMEFAITLIYTLK
jgi:hypothetical protein